MSNYAPVHATPFGALGQSVGSYQIPRSCYPVDENDNYKFSKGQAKSCGEETGAVAAAAACDTFVPGSGVLCGPIGKFIGGQIAGAIYGAFDSLFGPDPIPPNVVRNPTPADKARAVLFAQQQIGKIFSEYQRAIATVQGIYNRDVSMQLRKVGIARRDWTRADAQKLLDQNGAFRRLIETRDIVVYSAAACAAAAQRWGQTCTAEAYKAGYDRNRGVTVPGGTLWYFQKGKAFFGKPNWWTQPGVAPGNLTAFSSLPVTFETADAWVGLTRDWRWGLKEALAAAINFLAKEAGSAVRAVDAKKLEDAKAKNSRIVFGVLAVVTAGGAAYVLAKRKRGRG